HPPLYFIILWLTVRAIGSGQLAVHIPSIIAGTMLVPAIYLAGSELFDRPAAGLVLPGSAAIRVLHAVRHPGGLGAGADHARWPRPVLGGLRRADPGAPVHAL